MIEKYVQDRFKVLEDKIQASITQSLMSTHNNLEVNQLHFINCKQF